MTLVSVSVRMVLMNNAQTVAHTNSRSESMSRNRVSRGNPAESLQALASNTTRDPLGYLPPDPALTLLEGKGLPRGWRIAFMVEGDYLALPYGAVREIWSRPPRPQLKRPQHPGCRAVIKSLRTRGGKATLTTARVEAAGRRLRLTWKGEGASGHVTLLLQETHGDLSDCILVAR